MILLNNWRSQRESKERVLVRVITGDGGRAVPAGCRQLLYVRIGLLLQIMVVIFILPIKSSINLYSSTVRTIILRRAQSLTPIERPITYMCAIERIAIVSG